MLLLPSPAIFAMTAGHSRILRTVPVGRGLSGVCMHGSRGHCDVWEDPELQGCTRMLLPTKRVGVLERPNPSATHSLGWKCYELATAQTRRGDGGPGGARQARRSPCRRRCHSNTLSSTPAITITALASVRAYRLLTCPWHRVSLAGRFN
jgi:hypothetical protein